MIPIADPQLTRDEIDAVTEVLESGMLADGPEVRAFESEFAGYCDVDHGVATSNGTTALHTALEAIGIESGDKVITTPFSFVASANAIRFAGGEPVFADIDPETYTLDPDAVEEIARGDDDVAAILAVHLYGLPAEMGRLREIATEYDLELVEDAAQAHGAEHDGERAGSLGDVACFSFYPTKNMTTGEGGMVVTDRDDIAEHAASFVNHGRPSDGGYEYVRIGHNFRMTSVAAALGRKQLDRLPELIEARRDNAEQLTRGLAEASVETPTEPDSCRHVYHQYTIRHPDRDDLADYLDDEGIGTSVYYPSPIHEQPPYSSVTVEAPRSERAAEEVLSLPVHPEVSDRDIDVIAGKISEYDDQ